MDSGTKVSLTQPRKYLMSPFGKKTPSCPRVTALCAVSLILVKSYKAKNFICTMSVVFRDLEFTHRRKLDKSWDACHRQGFTFIPLAAECLGAWHPSAVTELKRLGSILARHTGEEESTSIQRLFQRLSISLMRGNAALFNSRSPPDPV